MRFQPPALATLVVVALCLVATAAFASKDEEVCDQKCKAAFVKCIAKCKGGDYPACARACDGARAPCYDDCLKKRKSGWLASPCGTADSARDLRAAWLLLPAILAGLVHLRRRARLSESRP